MLAPAMTGAAVMLLAAGCATSIASTDAGPSAAAPRQQHLAGGPATSASASPVSASPVSSSPVPSSTRPPLPTFSAQLSGPLKPKDVPFSWRHGCPVPPRDLRQIRMLYIGFDHKAYHGSLIVNASVARKIIKVFAILYRHRFPIKKMVPVDVFHGSDPKSMAADNTSGFNCRKAVAPGPPQWSMHAYGLAIDVNTVQNPYVEAGHPVQPPAGAAYTNRSDIRRGMAYTGGWLVKAFASIGWGWGGNWTGSIDYQHFSSNGR
jgi:hypothetical protein